MQTKTKMSAALLASLMLASCTAISADHSGGPTSVRDTSVGTVMTDSSGMTLYTFTKDSAGVSNCNGGCAASWPPFAAGNAAQDVDKFTVIERADGSKQWAYDGKPLYTWQGDTAPGDATGHGLQGAWYTIKVEQPSKAAESNYYQSGGY